MRNFLHALLVCLPAIVYAASHHPQQFLQSIRGTKQEGKQIYQHFCANCHAEKPLINLAAPKIANKADWLWRVQQGRDILFQHTMEGYRAMPARGGCFECSDEQLRLAIEFLLPKDYKKSIK